jgi:propanediol dehydratase small subunit
MTWATIAIVVLIIGIAIWTSMFGGHVPHPYRDRPCQGRPWLERFPESSKSEIREFLVLFADGFGFRHREKLQFSPDDELLKIYRAIYLRNSEVDALEFETLSQLFERRYRVSLEGAWRDDLTLGQLFELRRKK